MPPMNYILFQPKNAKFRGDFTRRKLIQDEEVDFEGRSKLNDYCLHSND